MATSLTLLAAIGVPVFIAVLTLFIAPTVSRRQTDKRLQEQEQKQAHKEREIEERQVRKEREEAERQIAVERAIAQAALEHLQKIVELREFFAVQTAQQKQVTDGEMDRARIEIDRTKAELDRATARIDQLSDRVEELKATVAQFASKP